MTLLVSAVIGAMFASGIYLMLRGDLFRVVAGLVLVSNAANLTLMSSGLTRGQAPILPLDPERGVADPLVQAMTLTALVIGFAVTAVLLALSLGVYRSGRSLDLGQMTREEAAESADREAKELAPEEAAPEELTP